MKFSSSSDGMNAVPAVSLLCGLLAGLSNLKAANADEMNNIGSKLEYDDSRLTQIGFQTALGAIYEATNGDEWLNNENWNNGGDPCDRDFLWYGLNCNLLVTPNTIVYLDLDSNGLSGTIPTEIALLTELRGLEAGGNDLSGTIPSEIGKFSELQVLTLHDNSLTGPIPSELGMLENAWFIRLNNNSFSSTVPDVLGDLSSLFYLYLHENEITGEIVCDDVGSQVMLITADCAGNNPEIFCDCCDGCSRPSSRPTDVPSPSPVTAAPTKAPIPSVPSPGSPNNPPQSPTSSPIMEPSPNAPSSPNIPNPGSPTIDNESSSPTAVDATPGTPIAGPGEDGSPSVAPSTMTYMVVPVMYAKRTDSDVDKSLTRDDNLLHDYFDQDLQATCPKTLSICDSASAAERMLQSNSLNVLNVTSRIDNSNECDDSSDDDGDCAYVITEVGFSYDSRVFPEGLVVLIAAAYTESFLKESSIPFDNLTPPIIEVEAALTKFTFTDQRLEGIMTQLELNQYLDITFRFLRALYLYSHEPRVLLDKIDFYTQDFDDADRADSFQNRRRLDGSSAAEFTVEIVISGRYIPPPILDWSDVLATELNEEDVLGSYLSAIEESNNSYFENVDNFDELELMVIAEPWSTVPAPTVTEVSTNEAGVVTKDDYGGFGALGLAALIALLLLILFILCFGVWRRKKREEEEEEENADKLEDGVGESARQVPVVGENFTEDDEQDIVSELGPLRASGITEDVCNYQAGDDFPDDVSELTGLHDHDHDSNPTKNSKSTRTADAPHTVAKTNASLFVDFPSRARR